MSDFPLSLADHYRFGICIKETAEKLGRRTIFIGSGDLSHRLKDDCTVSPKRPGI